MRSSDEIPGPPPANSIGAAYDLMKLVRGDLLGVVCEGFVQYGDVYRIEVLGRRQVLAIAPEQIREVLLDHASCFEKGRDYTDRRKGLAKFGGAGLVTSNGDFWKRQRRLVAPALHRKRIAGYAAAMIGAAERTLERWKPGQIVDVDHAMMETALDIVGRTLFSTDVRQDVDRIGEATQALHGMFEANNSVWTILPAWFPTLQRLREDRAVRTLDEIVYRLIRERRASEKAEVKDTGDLASMLLAAEDEDGSRMTDVQARDEIVTMFVAGHETAANTLAWCWILLAQHPEIEARVHAEVDRVLGTGPARRGVRPEDASALTFTEAAIKETLRLYPPGFTFMRSCIESTTLGDFAIPKGTDVSLVPYATHRDPRFFPDPLRFDPERFLGEREKEIDRYAWVPFGGGPRVCVGNAFALMETTLVVASIASRYRLRLAGDRAIPPVPGVTLRPSGPVKMELVAR